MKPWNKVAIVGVGLIGGSIGLALLRRNLAREVAGIGRDASKLESARQLGAISRGTTDLKAGVSDASLVIICTPVAQIAADVGRVAESCSSDCLITDAGSTKAQIVEQVAQLAKSPAWRGDIRFVGSHPLAGSEKRGAAHASPNLFVDRTVILTPAADTSAKDVESLRQFWSSVGARVVEMTPEEHDAILATTSHVPHVVASAMAAATPADVLQYTAGGWQDTTRIAGGDPELWQQILLSNRTNVLSALDGVGKRLEQLRQAIDADCPNELRDLLAEAQQVRNALGS
jgi:prephenate dehydrogenase